MMKLLASVSTLLLAGFAAAGAAHDAAHVYILDAQPQQKSSTAPSSPAIPRQIARQIILQRLSADRDTLLDDLPNGVDEEQAIAYLTQFGTATPSLFEETTASQSPAQAVVFLEGLTEKDTITIKAALKDVRASPSFSVTDPPRSKAIRQLLEAELPQLDVSPGSCGISGIVNPYDTSCWSNNDRFVASYDVKKASENVESFISVLPKILRLVEDADIEVMLFLMPETSRTSSIAHWTSKDQSHLRARAFESEAVMTEQQPKDTVPQTPKVDVGTSANNFALQKQKITVLTCFTSFDTCMTQTNNCTGHHGKCIDKYATGGQARRAEGEPKHCFKCHCQPTVIGQGKDGQYERTEKWGGAMCQKKDISVPFWLIVGFTVTIIGAITFAIGMLFQVGEQKLPGVIGAGVSRSK